MAATKTQQRARQARIDKAASVLLPYLWFPVNSLEECNDQVKAVVRELTEEIISAYESR
jgi:hypothetical protein